MSKEAERKLKAIGNYHLGGRCLGKGSFARVELATHMAMGVKVALKIIHKPTLLKDKYFKRHLLREQKILSRLSHPNIVRLFEVCHSSDIYCLVLEYVESSLLDRVVAKDKLNERESQAICGQLASALDYLHDVGIIHRDLKLENVLISDADRVVLIDFGLSNSWFSGKTMKTHCGSAEYASPELFTKDANYGPGVDVWSFGVIMYTILVGSMPFQTANSESLDGGVSSSEDLMDLIVLVKRGLGPKHFRQMSALSLDCRALLLRCLNVDQRSRIRMKSVLNDPWIRDHATEYHENSPAKEKQVAGSVEDGVV